MKLAFFTPMHRNHGSGIGWLFSLCRKTAFCLFVCHVTAHAGTLRGRVAEFRNGIPIPVEVSLPPTTTEALSNQLISFVNPPKDLTAGPDGCFCFDMADPRFAFVHAYYYGARAITEYNKLLESHFQKRLPQIQMQISSSGQGQPPLGGGGGMIPIIIQYDRPTFDHSLLIHEIGHEIHKLLVGTNLYEFLNLGSEWDKMIEASGFLEGTANILAALHTRHPRIGENALFELAYDTDTFVRVPDLVPHKRDEASQIVRSTRFRAAYPLFAIRAQRYFENPVAYKAQLNASDAAMFDLPQPYRASAVINQPLWQAAQIHGYETIQVLYLKTLAQMPRLGSYNDLADKLVEIADQPLKSFLAKAYMERGLKITH